MATELGVAYLSLAASTGGFARDVKKALGQAEQGFDKTSKKTSAGLATHLKRGAKVAGGAILGLGGVVAGLALHGGIDRALKIEGAQAKLKGLGNDTKSVEAIMKNATASVKGTAFGLGEAAQTAAGAVAAGIKPGDELEKMLKSVANSAAAAGVDMNDMGGIFSKVASIGKAQNDVLMQVADRGIPIYEALASQLGVTSEEVFKMASAGKIDFETFESAMTKASGTVAEEMGNTIPGKLANFRAALSRTGEKVVTQAMPYITDGLGWLTEKVDEWGPAAEAAGERIGQGLKAAAGWIKDTLVPAVKLGVEWMKERLGPIVQEVAQWVRDSLIPALRDFGAWLRDDVVPALKDTVKWVRSNRDWLEPLAVAIATATAAWKLYHGITTSVAKIGPAVTAAIKAMNRALKANPIGLVITAVAALVAGLVWFFTQTETGRAIVANTWAAIQRAIARVVRWWQSSVQPILTAGWDAIKNAAKAVADWYTSTLQPVMTAAWDGIAQAAQGAADWYSQHVAPVFTALGELVRAVVEEWIKPALDGFLLTVDTVAAAVVAFWESRIKPALALLGEAWRVMWGQIKKGWDVVGPPLLRVIGTGFTVMKTVVGGVLEQIKSVFSRVWNAIKITVETVLGVIRGIIETATRLIRGDWAGAWEAIKGIASTVWDGIKRHVDNAIGAVRDTISNVTSTIKGVWDTVWGEIKYIGERAWVWIRDTATGVFDKMRTSVTDSFDKMRQGIATAWDKIKSAVAKPINAVISFVNDGVIGAYNWVAEKVGLDALGKLKLLPGFYTGGFTGQMDPRRIAGVVHGREYVLTERETSQMGGPSGVEAWKNLALARGYRTGGAVRPVPGGHFGWRGGRYSSGKWHGGLDFGGSLGSPAGTPIKAMWAGVASIVRRLNRSYGHHVYLDHGGGMKTLYAHMSRILVNAGQRVSAGQVIGRVGNTGNSQGAHLHLEVRKDGRQVNPEPYLSGTSTLAGMLSAGKEAVSDALDGVVDFFGDFTSKFTNLLKPPKPEGMFGELAAGLAGKVASELKTWAKDKLNPLSGIGGYATGTASATPGWAWVGEQGPELMRFRGGEKVLPNQESMRATGGNTYITVPMPEHVVADAAQFFRWVKTVQLHAHQMRSA